METTDCCCKLCEREASRHHRLLL
uniref:Uncharacterized protein n=1 Tax=Arundo donax TaxID=35708 RepID=A0A0A9BKG1_ARUDO